MLRLRTCCDLVLLVSAVLAVSWAIFRVDVISWLW